MSKNQKGFWRATKPGIIVIIIGLVTTLFGLGLSNRVAISFGIVVIAVGMLVSVWCLPVLSASRGRRMSSRRNGGSPKKSNQCASM